LSTSESESERKRNTGLQRRRWRESGERESAEKKRSETEKMAVDVL